MSQNKKNNNNFVILFLGIAFTLFSFISIFFQYPSGETTFVTGTVIGTSCSTSIKGGTTCRGEFQYRVNGKKYEGNTGYSTSSKWRKGEKVTVIASKKNPDEYTTLGDMGVLMLFLILGLCALGGYIVLYSKKLKSENKEIGLIDIANDYYMNDTTTDNNNVRWNSNNNDEHREDDNCWHR